MKVSKISWKTSNPIALSRPNHQLINFRLKSSFKLLCFASGDSPLHISSETPKFCAMSWSEAAFQIHQLYGFRNCLVFLDGTTIVLAEKPTKDGEFYYNRKSQYSFNCQSGDKIFREVGIQEESKI